MLTSPCDHLHTEDHRGSILLGMALQLLSIHAVRSVLGLIQGPASGLCSGFCIVSITSDAALDAAAEAVAANAAGAAT